MSVYVFMRRVPIVAIVALAMQAGMGPSLAGEAMLHVTDAWIRLVPPTLKTHGGYMTIANHGSKAEELIGASSGNYEAVQVHISKIENGIATMQHLESVEIPAGGKAEFKPGGLHLMLMGAKKPLEKGAMVPVTLSFRSGAELEVKAMVMEKPHGEDGMKHMDHSAHGKAKTH